MDCGTVHFVPYLAYQRIAMLDVVKVFVILVNFHLYS